MFLNGSIFEERIKDASFLQFSFLSLSLSLPFVVYRKIVLYIFLSSFSLFFLLVIVQPFSSFCPLFMSIKCITRSSYLSAHIRFQIKTRKKKHHAQSANKKAKQKDIKKNRKKQKEWQKKIIKYIWLYVLSLKARIVRNSL